MAEVDKQAVLSRKRSPGYPTISIEHAISRVRILYTKDKGASTPADVIASHWETKTNSSTFMQDFASLKRFGLIHQAEDGNWKVSPVAVDILLMPEENPVRATRIKEVSMRPGIHKQLWNDYGLALPSEANLVHKLVTSLGFKENSARDLIKQYKKTLEFAKFVEGDKVSDEQDGDEAEVIGESGAAKEKPVADIQQRPFTDPFAMFRSPAKPKMQTPNSQGSINPLNPEPKQYALTTDTGDVILRWPAVLTKEDLETVELWMDSMKQKIKRSVKQDDQN